MKLFDKIRLQYIDEENVSWKKAICLVAKPLIEQRFVTDGWAEEVIVTTDKLGPYYVIAKNLAFPHISPGPNVLKMGTSFAVFKHSIAFSSKDHEHDVRFVLALATTDGESHMELLKKIIDLWNDKNFLNELDRVDSLSSLLDLVDRY